LVSCGIVLFRFVSFGFIWFHFCFFGSIWFHFGFILVSFSLRLHLLDVVASHLQVL
jgi:hypothetical protein